MSLADALCGTRREPDYVPEEFASPLTPEAFGIPRRARYNPRILERACEDAAREEDETNHLTARTWQREFERGALTGTKIGGTWWTTYAQLLAYFLRNSNVISMN